MPDVADRPISQRRVVFCAITVGLLLAALIGIQMESSGQAVAAVENDARPAADLSVETERSVRMTFAPLPALLGFLAGLLPGAAIGELWGRRGIGGIIGFLIVTLVGGFAGLVAAALLGAETRVETKVSATGRSVEMTHGAPTAILYCGATLGLALGALSAWRFGPPKRVEDPSPPLPA